jgi:hypothetical protein
MSRIARINFAGFALTAALLTTTMALSLFAMGCAKPVPVPIPPQQSQGFVSPNGAFPTAGTLTDISSFNGAQIDALMGIYKGSFPVSYDGEKVRTDYTLTLSKVSNVASAPGKTFVQAQMTANNVIFTTLVQPYVLARDYLDNGPRYAFTSPRFSAPGYNPYGMVIFQVILSVDQYSNLFDPTPTPIINIVDGVSYQAVVDFKAYDDFARY